MGCDPPASARGATLSTADHRFVVDAARALPGPAWLADRRLAAAERLAASELPTDAEEVWRYSRIGELDLTSYEPPAPTAPATGLPAQVVPVLEALGPRAGLVVTSGGHITRLETSAELEAAGARLGGTALEGAADLLGSVAWSTDALSELGTAFTVDAAVLVVPPGAELQAPVVIVHELPTDGAPPAAFPRTLVHVGANGSASVVEIVVSGEGPCYLSPVAELVVEDGARLSFHALHRSGSRTFQVARQASRVGRDALLVSLTAALGGDYARCRTDSVLEGQGGATRLLAAFFADGSRMHDWRTLQEHAAPRTSSDLLFKGAVAGTARSVYSGMIRIRHGARGSDAKQTNRNLVLSEGAHADSVPNLDIEEHDVRCSHASTVGPVDADQRYYLESRGVPQAVAERLILMGFFEDLFERSPAVPLRRYLPAELADHLLAVTAEAAR